MTNEERKKELEEFNKECRDKGFEIFIKFQNLDTINKELILKDLQNRAPQQFLNFMAYLRTIK